MKKILNQTSLKVIIAILTIILATALIISSSLAQSPEVTTTAAPEFDYNKAFQDYYYTTGIYNRYFDDYQSARAKYFQITTLATEDAAREATSKMLTARDDVIVTYLTAIRMKLRETSGLTEEDKNTTFDRIDTEITWYKDHKTQVPSAQTLSDLVTDSDEAKSHYLLTKAVVYFALIQVAEGKIDYFRNQLNENISDLKVKIGEIRENGDKNVIPVEHAIIDIENKVQRSRDKEVEAIDRINLARGDVNATIVYEDSLARMQESFLYLKEVNSNLREIIKQIKTQD